MKGCTVEFMGFFGVKSFPGSASHSLISGIYGAVVTLENDGDERRHQNSLPLTTNFSQKLTQPSGSVTQLVTFADVSQNGL